MYVICPKCNCSQHLNIQIKLEEWLKKHAPDTPPNELPKLLCIKCWRLMEPLSNRAYDLLIRMRRAPRMFAMTKAEFLAGVTTVLYILIKKFNMGAFHSQHVFTKDCVYLGLKDAIEDVWAHAVIDDALRLLSEDKSPKKHVKKRKRPSRKVLLELVHTWRKLAKEKDFLSEGATDTYLTVADELKEALETA